jgi:hypothetical protein
VVVKYNNLPTELLRAVGRVVGIFEWERESSRMTINTPNTSYLTELLRRLNEFAQLLAAKHGVGIHIVLTHQDIQNGLGAEFLAELLIGTFCGIWRYRRISMDRVVSNEAIRRHIAQCPSCSDQLVGDMELLVRVMTDDHRLFYPHLLRADVVEIDLSYEMSSLCRGLMPDDQDEVEKGFRELCGGSKEMQGIFDESDE